MINVDTSIFKSYDIRGIYPQSLDEDVAYRIGRAYAKFLQDENSGKKLKIVVSHDMRISGPALSEKLIEGLLDQGADVVDIGLSSTPTFYFSVAYYGYDGGLQVSASHNPKEYNGFKMVRSHGVPVSGDTGIQIIKDIVVANQFVDPSEKGTLEHRENVINDLYSSQKSEWKIDLTNIKPLKIVVDAANAMGAVDIEKMFEGLPCQLIKLNFNLDGSFPSHQPDPLVEDNLAILKQAIIENGADLGIAPDGDGDRYFIVDEKGETIRQEILRGIMAQIALKDYPGSAVCYDIRPGRITRDLIEQAGGKASVTRVGHSLIKEQMLKEGAVFGGESSGHYFYKFSYGTFEAPFVLIWKFLEYVSLQNKPLSEIVRPFKVYFHSGEINSTVADTKAKIQEIINNYQDANVSLLDGVTVEYDDWWFNVRASNTEPLIRLNLEAKSKELMEQKRDEVVALIRS